jgi:hypothetical protein
MTVFGRGEIQRRPNDDVVIPVPGLHHAVTQGLSFLIRSMQKMGLAPKALIF